MESQIKKEFNIFSPKKRINQGDILKDLTILNSIDYDHQNSKALFTEINLKYGIVVNQDCDLEHDFNTRNIPNKGQDKYLPNIFILPAYLASSFRSGTHRGVEYECEKWNSEKWGIIKQNTNPRFHFINNDEGIQLPDLVIDFKHLYTINREFLYKDIGTSYFASISELYRENLSHRYSFFLSRIGLPHRDS